MRPLSWFGIALMAGVAGAACAHSGGPPPATTTESVASNAAADDQAATELKEHHRHHHFGGVTRFIAMSLDTLGAADEAKRPQIEKLQADLKAHLAPAREAEKNLLMTIADGVAAGAIDTAKVNAAIERVATASSAVHDASADTLNQLHAILTPAERAALVEKVQAHWQVWRKVNHEAEFGGREHGGRLEELTQELNLTPEQVNQISTALHATATTHPAKLNPEKAENHVKAFSEAFASETFDARKLMTDANSELAAHGAERMARFFETVTPLLTPAQRTTLAEHLREHSTHPAPASGK